MVHIKHRFRQSDFTIHPPISCSAHQGVTEIFKILQWKRILELYVEMNVNKWIFGL